MCQILYKSWEGGIHGFCFRWQLVTLQLWWFYFCLDMSWFLNLNIYLAYSRTSHHNIIISLLVVKENDVKNLTSKFKNRLKSVFKDQIQNQPESIIDSWPNRKKKRLEWWGYGRKVATSTEQVRTRFESLYSGPGQNWHNN